MADIPLKWNLGIDNISSKTNLPHGTIADAVNVDIDRAGTLGRRPGYSVVAASNRAHSLWTSEARAESFCVLDGVLNKVTMPWSATPICSLTQDAPLSYTEINGDVVFSSLYTLGVIAADLSVRRLGLEVPGAPLLSATSAGGLDAGTYTVGICYLRGAEEGAMSRFSSVEIATGQGITVQLPPANEALPTGVRIYRTPANGDLLHRVMDVPIATTTCLLGATTLGRQYDGGWLARTLPGSIVRYWRGLLWTVRGNVAYYSEPLRYGVYDPRFNFVPMQSAIRVFEPVESGVFIGTRDGVFFLSGKGPREFEVTRLGGSAPIAGTGQRIPAALLGDEGDTGDYVVVWLAKNGFVIGTKEGKLIEKQRRRISLEGSAGVSAIHDRRIVAVVSS